MTLQAHSGNVILQSDSDGAFGKTPIQLAAIIAAAALLLTVLQFAGLLPGWMHRLPESIIPPFAVWLDAAFNFLRTDLKLEVLTRWFAEGPLQFLLDTTANILYGKRRWPNIDQIP